MQSFDMHYQDHRSLPLSPAMGRLNADCSFHPCFLWSVSAISYVPSLVPQVSCFFLFFPATILYAFFVPLMCSDAYVIKYSISTSTDPTGVKCLQFYDTLIIRSKTFFHMTLLALVRILLHAKFCLLVFFRLFFSYWQETVVECWFSLINLFTFYKNIAYFLKICYYWTKLQALD